MLETLSVESLLMEPPAEYAITPPDAVVTDYIHHVRGQKVMLDRDLAELYGVETKHLKRQVKRNLDRFPLDFMFELTASEWATLRYQFGTSNKAILSERGGSRVLPMAFTEQGVAMLSSVLNSEQAIQVNIHIIRVFTAHLPAGRQVREVLLSHREILQKLEQLEGRVTGYQNIALNFTSRALSSPNGGGVRRTEGAELVAPPETPRKSIGFKPSDA